MDTLFAKLDQLSGPLGALLDAVLNRLAPHTTASACGGNIYCGSKCTGPCRTGHEKVSYWANTQEACFLQHWSAICFKGCLCA